MKVWVHMKVIKVNPVKFVLASPECGVNLRTGLKSSFTLPKGKPLVQEPDLRPVLKKNSVSELAKLHPKSWVL
jgi:hypothetical protein